jgi:Bacterial SH3 domain
VKGTGASVCRGETSPGTLHFVQVLHAIATTLAPNLDYWQFKHRELVMEHKNSWQQTATLSLTPFLLGLPVVLTSVATASAVNPIDNSGQSQYQINLQSSSSDPESQFAQDINNCYQVVAEYGMYVREEPTVYSEAIAVLSYGQDVEIVPGGTEYWSRITEPIQGYVWSDWLTPCLQTR